MRSPSIPERAHAWAPALFVLALLAGCAGDGQRRDDSTAPIAASSTFPIPPELEDNVDFWRHVYGRWRRDQVAFHDDRYLGVIYEVAQLPGSTSESYTQAQRAWVRARKEAHAARVKVLQRRLLEGATLGPAEETLLARFDKVGGRAALAGAERRVRSQRGLRERFRRGVEISGRYDEIFREIMHRRGVPEDLAYLPHVESSFQVHARSKVGAGGVWQFMPSTARYYMTVSKAVDERFDPIIAADGAARYLAEAYRRLGSWPLAITSYNHGQGGMAKAKAIYGDDIGRIATRYRGRAFGFASRNFYAEFVAAREVAGNAKRYFPEGVRYEEPWRHDRLVLRYSMPAYQVARHYGTSTTGLNALNLHWNERVRTGRYDLPAGTTVWLPEGALGRVASHPRPPTRPIVVAARRPAHRPASPGTMRPHIAKASPKPKVSSARYHVVKPSETLYRVASQNGITVEELRRLNRMRPGETKIRPGQRLKVGI